MKSLVVAALCVLFVAAVWARPEGDEKYDDKLGEGVDIDEVLASDRLRGNYFRCFRSGEKCPGQAKKIKDIIPEALTTNCAKCTDAQKELVKKVLKNIITNHPDEFLELEKVYDKEHIYRTQYAKQLTDDGIVLPKLV